MIVNKILLNLLNWTVSETVQHILRCGLGWSVLFNVQSNRALNIIQILKSSIAIITSQTNALGC